MAQCYHPLHHDLTMNDAIAHNRPETLNNSYLAPEISNQRLQTLDALHVQAGETILDVGCGTGFLTHELALMAGASGKVVAMDLQAEMTDATQERCAHLPQVSAQTGDVTALPFGDEEFDAVTCTQVLLYVENVELAISEMRRVLKPGGRIAILETDWQGVVMHSQFPDITDRIMTAWDQSVASPNLPRTILAKMSAAGFGGLNAKAIPLLNTTFTENSFSVSSLEWLGKVGYKAGAVTKEESLRWIQDQKELGEKNQYFFCVNRFLFN
ncbi:MAG: methyltransferase domain-containing protein, partial [Pseudomonadota bacterium]